MFVIFDFTYFTIRFTWVVGKRGKSEAVIKVYFIAFLEYDTTPLTT